MCYDSWVCLFCLLYCLLFRWDWHNFAVAWLCWFTATVGNKSTGTSSWCTYLAALLCRRCFHYVFVSSDVVYGSACFFFQSHLLSISCATSIALLANGCSSPLFMFCHHHCVFLSPAILLTTGPSSSFDSILSVMFPFLQVAASDQRCKLLHSFLASLPLQSMVEDNIRLSQMTRKTLQHSNSAKVQEQKVCLLIKCVSHPCYPFPFALASPTILFDNTVQHW